jgi:hypothetical protein
MSLAVAASPEALTHPVGRRTKTPRATRPASRQGDTKPKKVSFYLSPESLKRLGIHATMEGKSQSALVEELVQGYLRRYEMPRAARSTSSILDTTEDRQSDPT